jgi:hypothetical protein
MVLRAQSDQEEGRPEEECVAESRKGGREGRRGVERRRPRRRRSPHLFVFNDIVRVKNIELHPLDLQKERYQSGTELDTRHRGGRLSHSIIKQRGKKGASCALQTLVEGRAAKTERVSDVRLGVPVGPVENEDAKIRRQTIAGRKDMF